MSKNDHLSDLRAHTKEPKTGANLPQEDVAVSWLSAIIESADDAIISKTLDGIIASWNRGAERIFGYRAEEVIGKPVLILIPQDHQDEEPEILKRIKAGERVDHYETIRRRKDGKLIDVSLTISPIKSGDGRIVGASKVVRDITHRKRTEDILKEQTEIVETINRIGQMLSAELDQQTLVQSVTDAATELTGAQFGAFFYNVENQDGASYMLYTLSGVPREAFSNFPMPRATDMFGPTFRGEGTIRIANVTKDARYGNNSPYRGMPEGHLPVTSYLAVSVTSRSGEVIGGLFFGHSEAGIFTERHEQIIEGIASQVAVAMDNARLYDRAQRAIREREELLRREQEARQQVEEASRAKDEFLGLISHEIRTPLNAILGWTSMLTSAKLDSAAVAGAIETIDRNARLQARLIEDMLDISRIMTGKLRLDAQPMDLTTVINGAVESLRPAADAREIRIYSVLDYGAGLVLGDSTRLQQVIWNLLSNAIKFTPKGGSVRIYLERINSHLEISVSDTGPGIDEEFLPFVFDRFRQADSSTTKKHGGLGLGLSIVRQLVELHGGTVEAANRTDETGAVFTVKLPVMAVRSKVEKPVRKTEPVNDFAEDPVSLENSAQLNGVRVIAVDDDADARLLLQAVLESRGAEVKVCESAAEALESIDRFEPHILVSDIGMPDEDGYSLIKKIRATEGSFRRIPAVALTAFARVEDRLKALSAGFNMHVPKPVEPLELTMVIASLINHK
jgi:PAS domain S-box-containing protein